VREPLHEEAMENQPTAATPPPAQASAYNATVAERQDLTPELAIVKVVPDQGPAPAFSPGQYTLLGMPPDDLGDNPTPGGRPRLIRRAYSISSAANERRFLEFYVVLVEGGKLSTRLWTVPAGGRVWMDDTIRGRFTLDHAGSGADLLFVATGTGIAPFMAILRTYRDAPRWRRCVLVHGVRHVADLGYRHELEALAATTPHFVYVPVVSRAGEEGWRGARGHVQATLFADAFEPLAGARLDPATFHAFLCGNPAMIESTRELLEARGFKHGQVDGPGGIHYEKYW
jgi:ferredoxin/flavodoxin---NADP+ reductase